MAKVTQGELSLCKNLETLSWQVGEQTLRSWFVIDNGTLDMICYRVTQLTVHRWYHKWWIICWHDHDTCFLCSSQSFRCRKSNDPNNKKPFVSKALGPEQRSVRSAKPNLGKNGTKKRPEMHSWTTCVLLYNKVIACEVRRKLCMKPQGREVLPKNPARPHSKHES